MSKRAQLSPVASNRRVRRELRRFVDTRQAALEAFFELVSSKHRHLFRRRSPNCPICKGIEAVTPGAN